MTLGVLVLLLTLLAAELAVALAGNLAVLVVLGQHLGIRTATNWFIASLSVCDLLMALGGMPVTLAALLTDPPGSVLGDGLCVFNGSLLAFLTALTTFMVAFIAADRYLVVVKISRRTFGLRAAAATVAGCALGAALLAAPWYLLPGAGVPPGPPPTTAPSPPTPASPSPALNTSRTVPARNECSSATETGYSYYYKEDFPHCMYVLHGPGARGGLLYSLVFTVIGLVLPMAAMTLCALRLLKILRHSDNQIRPASAHVTQLRFSGEMRTAKTVVVMVMLHLLCKGPYCVMALVVIAVPGVRFTVAMDIVATWLLWANSALNPVIYAVRNPTVRQLLRCGQKSGYTTQDGVGGRHHHPQAASAHPHPSGPPLFRHTPYKHAIPQSSYPVLGGYPDSPTPAFPDAPLALPFHPAVQDLFRSRRDKYVVAEGWPAAPDELRQDALQSDPGQRIPAPERSCAAYQDSRCQARSDSISSVLSFVGPRKASTWSTSTTTTTTTM